MAADPAKFRSFPPPPATPHRGGPLPTHVPLPRIAPLPPAMSDGVACYEHDIDAYLRSMEAAPGRRPAPDYMTAPSRQRESEPVSPSLRTMFVDWLTSLAEPTFRLHSRTLHLAVSCLDRFLAAPIRPPIVAGRDLVIVAAAALLIAAKYEEITPPEADKLAAEACRVIDPDGEGCTKEDLLAWERAVLTALRHELGTPTAHTFLEHFSERHRRLRGAADEEDEDEGSTFLASYVAELSLLDLDVLRFRPSVVAASAMFVARLTARPCEHPWGSELERATGYAATELKECAEVLHRLHLNTSNAAAAESGSSFLYMRKVY